MKFPNIYLVLQWKLKIWSSMQRVHMIILAYLINVTYLHILETLENLKCKKQNKKHNSRFNQFLNIINRFLDTIVFLFSLKIWNQLLNKSVSSFTMIIFQNTRCVWMLCARGVWLHTDLWDSNHTVRHSDLLYKEVSHCTA